MVLAAAMAQSGLFSSPASSSSFHLSRRPLLLQIPHVFLDEDARELEMVKQEGGHSASFMKEDREVDVCLARGARTLEVDEGKSSSKSSEYCTLSEPEGGSLD